MSNTRTSEPAPFSKGDSKGDATAQAHRPSHLREPSLESGSGASGLIGAGAGVPGSLPSTGQAWWGPHAIPIDESRFWQIGPLRLWARHRQYQWQLAWENGADWLAPDIQANVPPSGHSGGASPGQGGLPQPSERARRLHCAYRETVNELSFAPALADRSLVTKLETPLRVLPGEEIRLFVCAPLWLRIETVQPTKTMHELPIFRLSDSWFGPVGPAGELAYASRVPVYLQMKDVPLRLHCAITSVVVRNLGSDALNLERLNLPMPRLSLFYSRKSGFWTDALILEGRDGSEHAQMRSEHSPPKEAAPHQFIAPPRLTPPDGRVMVRAFSGLFK